MGSWRTLFFQCLGLAGCLGLIGAISPSCARAWILVAGIVALVFFAVVSSLRHRQIKRLASQIDEVLHNGREVDFSNCSEGDIAMLSNELAKMVSRLDRTNHLLESERNCLADALADVSHQIRTPLTAAALMLPKIERADDPIKRKHAVRRLESMLDRVAWLVTSLLKIAKVDAGAIQVERRTVMVQDVATQAAEPLLAAMDLHDIELICEIGHDACFEGDRRWTIEAVENILKNCMEHTPSGGTVTLSACTDALAARIRITDTGPGFLPDELPHVFDRFYQGSQDREGDLTSAGFGIGLALAQALISAQGGTLSASNGPQGGARFDIAFPKLVV